MKLRALLSATALSSAALVATLPTAAFAQTTPTDQSSAPRGTAPEAATDQQDRSQDESIVVTGSRIRSPNLVSDVPVTSISGESMLANGQTNIGSVLNDLPQLASSFSQQNPGSGIGIGGLNLLDLRSLGTSRTLVLVNGRRHVAADILVNAVSPDVNSIPNDLIERVDIVTGGNSAVYGSDAIAGVVNFVLKRDYNGLQVRGSTSVNEPGFGANQFISAVAGHTFADGRGNITISGQFSHQDRVFASDIPFDRQNNGIFTVDTDPSGLANGSDGFPDAVFVRDVRSATNNPYGLIPIQQTPGIAACGTGTLPTNGGPNSSGTPYNCTYIFTQDGRLTPQTGARFGSGPTGGIVGGNGATGREGQTVSILPFLERYNFNLLSHYEFSPAAEVFLEAKFDRVKALGNNAGPSFIQTGSGNTGNVGDARERPRIDNPFLNPADRATLAGLILASNCNTSLTATCPSTTNIGTAAVPNLIPGNLTAANRAAIADGSYRFQLARNLLDVGLRDEKFTRDTFRVVGGLRGKFNDDWSYEISANYGEFNQTTNTNGFIDRQRFSLAMDAGRNPANGQIQCRAQYDPASAIAIQRAGSGDAAVNAARLAADIAACKPYNPFGGSDNSASVAYFSRAFDAKAKLTQLDIQGFVNGDSSQLFELPGGPVRFALGGEYRREKAYYRQDPFVTDGYTNGVSIPLFDPPAFVVKEAFGEIQVPILKDVPFFKELSATGAGRYSDYGKSLGSTWTYNGGVQWAPIRDIRFRANYGRAVRAPNVSETGFPLVPNFANNFQDPCQANNIGANGANRTANCTAALTAAQRTNLVNGVSLPIVSGSNPNLQPETSDSWTFGGVLQPSFIPGLSITVDYYNIQVKDIIVSVAAQTIVNQCYDSATLNNVFCSAFSRYLGAGTGPAGELPGQILANSLVQAPLNFAKRVRKGIDFQVAYHTDLSANVKFNTNMIYVKTLTNSDYQDPTNPNFETHNLENVGNPTDEFQWDTDLGIGPVTFGYRLHLIGPQYVTSYANFNSVNGFPPANSDASAPIKYPVITYSDLQMTWDIGNKGKKDAFQLYAGVDNVFNQLPPLGTLANGAGTAIYRYNGRAYHAGFRARF
ncbi:TonB-dependent receptor [Sphingomonas sp. RB3P16]|uniref:TonB-dependent receptor domain-containing protein n=1 Tax=Parasphingomonas frigoris TaxID=3096163 RepID=UPI002FC74E4B